MLSLAQRNRIWTRECSRCLAEPDSTPPFGADFLNWVLDLPAASPPSAALFLIEREPMARSHRTDRER